MSDKLDDIFQELKLINTKLNNQKPIDDFSVEIGKRERRLSKKTFGLDSAQTDEQWQVIGNYLRVQNLTGTLSIRLDDESNESIDLIEGDEITCDESFWRILITNSAQAGKTATLEVGRGVKIERTGRVLVTATGDDVTDDTADAVKTKGVANSGVDIGDVDILSIAAGTAVIGKVRQVTATGDEVTDDTADAVKVKGVANSGVNIGDVGVLSITAGTNVIGKVRQVTATGDEITDDTADAIKAILQANSGVDIGAVDILSITAGTNVIGKVRQVTATGDEVTNDTKDAVKIDEVITKTVQTEPLAITAVAADAQSISSVLDLSGQVKQITILIDHAKDNANASVGQGTEYVVQVSQKASGNDAWRTLASFTAAITAPVSVVTDAEEVAGQTVIECSAAVPAVGGIIFFRNATIANSEWANIIAVDATGGAENFTIESALTNTQAQGTYYTQGEHFVLTVNVKSITRLRVVCNNTKGTTNQAIVWRCAAITSE